MGLGMRMLLCLAGGAVAASTTPRNLLFVVVDDLRPTFKPFSAKYGVEAPNLEHFSESAMVFHNTYVQQPVCGPSRNSFLTGRRPDSTRTWNFRTSFRESGVDSKGVPGKDWHTIPSALRDLGGFIVTGMGKIFHPGSPAQNDCTKKDCRSWTTHFQGQAGSGNVSLDGHPVLRCGSGGGCDFDYVNPDAQIFDVCLKQEINGSLDYDPTCCDLPDENCTDLWL
eukprot:Hpha_TRINITY_DN35136_c0_g1::TRINITY_DN35136_c0_g1_i1::g.168487::m.168487/K01136/IDS; iduronate 2-sulfatase